MIFSVYGHIKKCDLIRDWKTGQSLQYAFIEYETKAACEEAYFKMDNALVDERRIHVDFSQSVSRLWNKFRRREAPGPHDAAPRGDISLKPKYDRSQHQMIEDSYQRQRGDKSSFHESRTRDTRTRRDYSKEDRGRKDHKKKDDHKKKSQRFSSSSSDSSSRSSSSSSRSRHKEKRSRSKKRK